MPNYILKDKLTINNDLTVSGTIYIVKHENLLSKIDGYETYEPISGEYENLEINGNLIVCEFSENYEIVVGNTLTSIGNELLE